MNLMELRKAAAELETILRLQTYPLAVKMLKNAGEIPREAKRPVTDLGHRLSTCQLFAMARRQGMTLAQLKEDMWCVLPVLGYGMAEPPDYFMDGNDRFTGIARTPEAGRTWAQAFPRLRVGEYVGVAAAPAKAAGFEPDLIIVYCDPSQLTQLLNAKNWIDGLDIECKLSGHAACVYAVVPTIQAGQWHITTPCPGDRVFGLARDDEMIAAFPATALPDAVEGLVNAQKHGFGLPLSPKMSLEYETEEVYVKIGRMMGMDWLK